MEVDIIGIGIAWLACWGLLAQSLIESSRAMDYEDFVLLIEVSGSGFGSS